DIEVRLHAVPVDHRHGAPEDAVAVVVLARIAEGQGQGVCKLSIDGQRPHRALVGIEIQPAIAVPVDTDYAGCPAAAVGQRGGYIGHEAAVVPAPHHQGGVGGKLVARTLADIVHGAGGIAEPRDQSVGATQHFDFVVDGSVQRPDEGAAERYPDAVDV